LSNLIRPASERRVARDVWRIVAWTVAFRVLTAFIALLVNLVFPLDQREQFTVFGSTSPFWDTFARYDTGYFEGIAWDGYAPLPGGRSNIAYFPVYPLLIRYIGRMFGRHHATFYITGIGIAWVSFVLAMVALYYLARLDLPRRQAERAVLLTTVFPFAFFFGVAYSEATFLLFAVLAFYGFRTRRWVLGGLCGALATATRVPGVMMLPALAWVALETTSATSTPAAHPSAQPVSSRWIRPAQPRDRMWAAFGLLLAASGFGAYCFYIYYLTGNPFEWAATLQRWGYHPGGAPWVGPARLIGRLLTHPYAYLASDPMAPYDTLYGVTGIAFALLIPFVWMKFGAGYGLYVLLNLWLPLSSGVFEGVGRYCAILFPAFLWLATIRSRTVSTAIVITFALFYTLGLALFTTIHPLF
jgi:mannosyltransferase PIG-V